MTADEDRGRSRPSYDDKPVCGRCGSTITGVVPRLTEEKILLLPGFDRDKPLCRDCLFELELLAQKAGGRVRMEVAEPLAPEEKRRRATLAGILAVLVLFLGWRLFAVAEAVAPSEILRLGAADTDSVTDRCIENLWRLSKLLQEDRLPETPPRCPASGLPYRIEKDKGNTVIACPSPAEHGLESLTVSEADPIPYAKGREEP